MKRHAFLVSVVIIFLFLITFISAEKLGIDIKNPDKNIQPGEDLIFTITLYDDNLNKIQGAVNYEIQNFYTEIMQQGASSSGQQITFSLPTNSIKGHWGIIAKYNSLEKRELFNVLELEKIELRLEEDYLVITNTGNQPVSSKQISISIGDHSETALVSLEISQTKKIRLTAPQGEYDIRVSDGTEENTFEVKDVSLTGNVIGLERLKEKSFWEQYPLVIIFLFSLIIIALIIWGLRFQKRYLK